MLRIAEQIGGGIPGAKIHPSRSAGDDIVTKLVQADEEGQLTSDEFGFFVILLAARTRTSTAVAAAVEKAEALGVRIEEALQEDDGHQLCAS